MKRRNFIKQLALSAAVAAAVSTLSFGSPTLYAQQKTVKIGVLHSLSGTMAIWASPDIADTTLSFL